MYIIRHLSCLFESVSWWGYAQEPTDGEQDKRGGEERNGGVGVCLNVRHGEGGREGGRKGGRYHNVCRDLQRKSL